MDTQTGRPRKIEDRVCPTCNKTFRPSWSGRKYCSKPCSDKGRKTTPVSTVCEVCGKEVPVKRGRIRRFCSQECFWKAPHETVLEDKKCLHCGKEFHPRWAIQNYCSRECTYLARRKNTGRICPQCGKPVDDRKPHTVKFCSVECAAVHRKIHTRKLYTIGEKKNAGNGYILLKVGDQYPNAREGWILEHRYVVEKMLGRTLSREEQVHHKNGIRSDNRQENLEVFVQKHHPSGARASDLVEQMKQRPEFTALDAPAQTAVENMLKELFTKR